jgi:hypothetical protein
MPQSQVPVLRSVFAAYAFFIAHWRPILVAGIPYTAAYAAQLALLQTQRAGDAQAVLGLGLMVLSIVTLVTSVALSAAALRMAVRGDFGGWLGLRLGQDEFRVFVVSILVALLTLIVFVLVFLFWGTLFGTIAAGSLERAGIDPETAGFDLAQATGYMGTADWVIVVLSGLAGLAIVAWLSARLVLSLPATIAQGAIRVMKVWPLSHRNGWRIAAALVLAGVPVTIVELGLYEVLSAMLGHRVIDVTAVLGPEFAETPGIARMREYSLWMGLFSAINIPVFSGLYAYIHQNRTRALA